MRVISGKAGGRKLQAPKGATTRPTPDRVKEALFSILHELVEGARVLDLFAGSGALGIEALSRGASHATFVEQDRAALVALAANLVATQTSADVRHTVLATAVHQAARALGTQQKKFDLVFVDPPYAAHLVQPTLKLLMQHALLTADTMVVAEHMGKTASPAPPQSMQCVDLRNYGDVALSFYRPILG